MLALAILATIYGVLGVYAYKAIHLFIFFFLCVTPIYSSMIFMTGGIESPFIISIFGLGPIMFLYWNRKIALLTSLFMAVAAVGLFLYELLFQEFPQHLEEWAYQLIWVCTFLYNSVLICLTMIMYKNDNRRKRKRLRRVNSDLRESNEDLSKFAYIASHDLKTPLRSIIGFINLLEKGYKDKLDDAGEEYLSIMSTNATQMFNLVEDILEFSRTRDKAVSLSNVDLNKMIDIIKDEILGKSQYAVSEISYEPMPILISDSAILKQCLYNIIENGLKYNHSDLPRVHLSHRWDDDSLVIDIRDNGIGIDEKYQKDIFEMFKRLHSKNEYQGTGIGLAMSQRIMDVLGGRITVSSTEGLGSTFSLYLPELKMEDDQAE